jgi:EAL domain-containing protein (putative c-di-GMP-specific phosphodiesterase class I)
VGRRRSETEEQVADLLRTARSSLGLSLSFLTRMDGTTQHLEVVESAMPLLFRDGITQPQETTFCQAILEGRLPNVIPDVAALPEAKRLPAARFPRIRSFVSVPVVLSDGSLYGTFCAAGFTRDRGLAERDKALMDVLAHAAAVVIEPGVRAQARESEIRGRLAPLVDGGGPDVVLQPIVELGTGRRVGAEALSRFPAAWGKAPDACFAEAHDVGDGHALELLAIAGAAAHLDRVGGYVAMNVSPGTLLTPECGAYLESLPLHRVVLELSEHDPVADYGALLAVVSPLRDRGMRLAIDDVGAGFSSLRHIVLTGPDVIKLDRSIVHGVAGDRVLRTLVRALTEFAHGSGVLVVAEGVEQPDDAEALLRLGVDYGQGWHFGRPGPPEALSEAVPAAAPQRGPAPVPEPAPQPAAQSAPQSAPQPQPSPHV